jgi:hypothetical protein
LVESSLRRAVVAAVRSPRKIFTRGPAMTLRYLRRRALGAAYRRGAAAPARTTPGEESDPVVVATGHDLRAAVLAEYVGKHTATGYRVLMLEPPSITAQIWFGDLKQCMQHAGIECRVLPPTSTSAQINEQFEALAPNVFITTETSSALRILDLPFIERYKRARGCLRLFIPVWHANAPRTHVPVGHGTARDDAERRRLRRQGLGPDALFSIFEPEFHERFSLDREGPVLDYLTVAQGCNPFSDFPLAAAKRYDYIMATSMTDDRVEVSYRYLRPVLSRYRGLWAGPNWGFGLPGVAPAEMPLHYAQTRIALSPLVGFVHRYGAEVTHRVYATAACGAFQITMPTAITHRYFEPGELVQAASPEEYSRLFDHYVSRPAERNAIALAALRRVYSQHTCFHRIDRFVSHWDEWRRKGLF